MPNYDRGRRPGLRAPTGPTPVHRRLCRRPALSDAARLRPAQAVTIGGPTTSQTCKLPVTNAVRCVPPENKPTPAEARTCRRFLEAEIGSLTALRVILALGRVAHDAVVAAAGGRPSAFRFAHGAAHELPNGLRLVDSYHCSRYNTQTGVLTPAMFREAVGTAQGKLGSALPPEESRVSSSVMSISCCWPSTMSCRPDCRMPWGDCASRATRISPGRSRASAPPRRRGAGAARAGTGPAR